MLFFGVCALQSEPVVEVHFDVGPKFTTIVCLLSNCDIVYKYCFSYGIFYFSMLPHYVSAQNSFYYLCAARWKTCDCVQWDRARIMVAEQKGV